jgi:methylated-DNA-[protein]-cysteine S-methyltransferase
MKTPLINTISRLRQRKWLIDNDITMKYVVFKTRWGWFGLLAGEQGLFRTSLPTPTRQTALYILLKDLNNPDFDKRLYKGLQDKIIAYFEGKTVDFNTDTPVFLQNLSPFTRSVLSVCRKIPFGQTSTYSAFASAIGRPKAVRAVANALARNPLPLIIPCHRVIRSDGKIGGFSAPGGINMKARMLRHEKSIPRAQQEP